MRTLLLVTLLLINFGSYTQERDSFLIQKGYYEKQNWVMSDTSVVFAICDKAQEVIYTEAGRSEHLCRAALKISEKLESSEGRVRAYLGLSQSKIYQNQNDSALHYVKVAEPIARKNHLRKLIIKCLDQEAIVYAYMEKFDTSTDLCFKAIKKGEAFGEKYGIRSKATLGYVFMKLGNLDRSSQYSQEAFELSEKYKDTSVMLTTLNILALNLKNSDKPQEALEVFKKGLHIAIQSNNLQRQSQIHYNMSNILMQNGQNKEGLEYFNKSIEISKLSDSYLSTAINFHSLAYSNWEFGNGRAAIRAADSAIYYANLSKSYELIMEAYAIAATIQHDFGSMADAYAFMSYAYAYKDSMNIAQQRDASLMAESEFEEEKRRIQDSLKTVQQELKMENQNKINSERLASRDRLIWIFGIAIILFLIAGYFIIKNNRLIKSQNDLVNRQKEEIQLQHTEIRDSIDYAQRIQSAMINKRSEWDKLGAHYILFRPKDVVSGDFYWAHNKGKLSIWVVADCTGHGVPGAFMSMLGFGFLNEIIIERDCSDAAEILNLLRIKIVAALGGKGENQARDGMDVSICIWNKETNALQYAGANNPLWIIRHKSSKSPEFVKRTTSIENSALMLLEIEPDKIPVGFVDGSSQPFTNKEVQLLPGDTIIQLTDGYADQFGGPNGKKLKYAPMKRALIEMQSLQLNQQFEKLSQIFDDWKGDQEQVDDVCVVAVKVS